MYSKYIQTGFLKIYPKWIQNNAFDIVSETLNKDSI